VLYLEAIPEAAGHAFRVTNQGAFDGTPKLGNSAVSRKSNLSKRSEGSLNKKKLVAKLLSNPKTRRVIIKLLKNPHTRRLIFKLFARQLRRRWAR
jgi:hypothetical protein